MCDCRRQTAQDGRRRGGSRAALFARLSTMQHSATNVVGAGLVPARRRRLAPVTSESPEGQLVLMFCSQLY
jgi:hypothetical protein